MSRIFWAGDSTVKENDFTTYPQTGIGQGIRLFIKKEIEIINHAENGRSTKSFLDEFRLAAIYNDIKEDDFLFIQFGHNDSKIEDPGRYTKAFGDYQENLEKFVNAARNKMAHPVFITPLCRRYFVDETHLEEKIHGDYPKAMIETGKKLKVPVIDLFSMSREFLLKVGDEGSKRYFMHLAPDEYSNYPDGLTDNTHLKYEGAVAFGGLVAKGLKELGDIYWNLLIEPERLDIGLKV
ncbi:rhamnogalacturonan acetylesterase [Anaerocolumna aminovalerica]|jgi:lysophospholipase L1-like esterase|uniref:rhamnogalacturonan acetylesterase n=1 Tax=Anaerocolumna aminovalerica TaxID=1527 RepID=UPI000BE2F7A5|nr:rhamnogalacturonan acetylesterase [Anaerocolumna aminovalerica]